MPQLSFAVETLAKTSDVEVAKTLIEIMIYPNLSNFHPLDTYHESYVYTELKKPL